MACCTQIGWLERMTQYRAKATSHKTVSTGLLTYPTLQAADILLYRADLVPVGDDQKAHIEVTRDIALRFNTLFGDCFKLPQPMIRSSGARIMGLDDPTVKMSKSIAKTKGGHARNLLDSPDLIRKKIMSAVTDSGNEVRFEHALPGVKNPLVLFEAMSGESRLAIEGKFIDRGYGYLKRELTELAMQSLSSIQTRYHEIERILGDGADRANVIAEETLAEAKRLLDLGDNRLGASCR